MNSPKSVNSKALKEKLTSASIALLALSLSLVSTGCQSDKKTDTEKTVTSEIKDSDRQNTDGKGSMEPGALPVELSDLPQLKGVNSVNLVKLPDAMIICTVDGAPITVSKFKREYQNAVISLQSMLSTQPDKLEQLLAQAKQSGLTLTAEEKKKMLESAHSPQALEGKPLAQFLKERNMTPAQFDQQVADLGLAFKCGTRVIESQLLSEMINRELVLKEAHKAGFYQKAVNSFVQIKDNKKYKQFVDQSSETPEQIREQIISAQMIKMEMDSIAKSAPPASAEVVKKEFDANKDRLKHGERVRLSHIVIAAPAVDAGPLKSVRTQLQEQRPELKGAELDNEVKVVQQSQYNKAKDILNQALKGADFKTLADNNTQDDPARINKTGGDLGYMDMSGNMGPDQLKILAAVSKLKAGQVAPEVIETNFGYHIVKVTERQMAGDTKLEEVQKPLQEMISAKNKEQTEIEWMKDHRKKADIKLTDEFNKAAASGAYGVNSNAKAAPTAATPAAAPITAAPANSEAKGNSTEHK